MKKIIITPLLSLFFVAVFSQDMGFEVRGKYKLPVKKEQLQEARFIRDFIPYYPVSWIAEYVSVQILSSCNGKNLKAISANDSLSKAQKNILQEANLGTDIAITVHYKSKNAVTGKLENSRMNLSITVIPEKEAAYIGGTDEMKKYLKENAINKISEPSLFVRTANASKFQPAFKPAVLLFTVNENGKTENVRISKSSGDTKTDKLLMETILKMPGWKPAENAKGIKVKQEFEFRVGENGC